MKYALLATVCHGFELKRYTKCSEVPQFKAVPPAQLPYPVRPVVTG